MVQGQCLWFSCPFSHSLKVQVSHWCSQWVEGRSRASKDVPLLRKADGSPKHTPPPADLLVRTLPVQYLPSIPRAREAGKRNVSLYLLERRWAAEHWTWVSASCSFLQESPLQWFLYQLRTDWLSRDISRFRHSLFFLLLSFHHPSGLCYFASLPILHAPHRMTASQTHRILLEPMFSESPLTGCLQECVTGVSGIPQPFVQSAFSVDVQQPFPCFFKRKMGFKHDILIFFF